MFSKQAQVNPMIQKPGNTTGLIQKALAVRAQIIERYREGALVYERDMITLSHELDLMARLGETAVAGRILGFMGAIETQRGHYIAAYDYFMGAMRFFDEAGDDVRVCGSLSNLGEVFRLWGKHEQALQYYDKARILAHEHEDWARLALILNNMGLLYLADGDTPHALEQLLASIEYGDRVTPRPDSQGETYSGIAQAYLALGQLEEAHQAASQALEISQGVNRADLIGLAYRTLGEVATRQNFTRFEPGYFFERSRTVLHAAGATPEYGRTLLAEARWLFSQQKVTHAADNLNEAITLFEQLALPMEADLARQMLAEHEADAG
jgi:tetratricopeptide (TPR) repeat protein